MNNLQKIRKEKKLSQSQLAALSGISLRTLQNYEQGHRSINSATSEHVYKLSQVLGCTIQDVLEITNA